MPTKVFTVKEKLLLLACFAALVAIWIINWKTLAPLMLADSIKIILVFLAIILPLPVVAYFVANRKIPKKSPNWRFIFVLAKISLYVLGMGVATLVVAFTLPAIDSKWNPATQLLFYASPAIFIASFFIVFLFAYIKPYLNAEEETGGETDCSADCRR